MRRRPFGLGVFGVGDLFVFDVRTELLNRHAAEPDGAAAKRQSQHRHRFTAMDPAKLAGRQSGRVAVEEADQRQVSVGRDLEVFHGQGAASRSLEAGDIPVILDVHLAGGDEEIRKIEILVILVDNFGAEEQPV